MPTAAEDAAIAAGIVAGSDTLEVSAEDVARMGRWLANASDLSIARNHSQAEFDRFMSRVQAFRKAHRSRVRFTECVAAIVARHIEQ